jgi:hypothetical protein
MWMLIMAEAEAEVVQSCSKAAGVRGGTRKL